MQKSTSYSTILTIFLFTLICEFSFAQYDGLPDGIQNAKSVHEIGVKYYNNAPLNQKAAILEWALNSPEAQKIYEEDYQKQGPYRITSRAWVLRNKNDMIFEAVKHAHLNENIYLILCKYCYKDLEALSEMSHMEQIAHLIDLIALPDFESGNPYDKKLQISLSIEYSEYPPGENAFAKVISRRGTDMVSEYYFKIFKYKHSDSYVWLPYEKVPPVIQ